MEGRSSTSRGIDTACVASSGACTDDGSFAAREDQAGKEAGDDVSLREWLDRPDRSPDPIESLHIFRQVADAVSLAHAQGVVVGNIRPSCFVLSSFNRVFFIESASCSSGSDSSEESREERGNNPVVDEDGEEEKAFPLKQILMLEFNWYTSPEEAAGDLCTFASDIYRLGVLLFEVKIQISCLKL